MAGAGEPGASPWPLLGLALVAGLSLLGVLLYHRITRHDALALDTRRRIFEAVKARPGIRVGTLAEDLGLDYTVVKRHVLLLAGLGFVHARGEGQRHWFVVGQLGPDAEQAVAEALCNPAARAVYGEVQQGPRDLAGLARALHLAPSTVSTAAGRLVRAGLVLRELRAGCVVLRPARPAATLASAEAPGTPA